MVSEEHPSWTVNTLKSYTDQRFADSDKAVLAALQANKENAAQTSLSTDKRFDQLNEKLDVLQSTVTSNTGGQSVSQRTWTLMLPTLMSAGAIMTVIILHKP
jgi:hypothetical protein